MARLPSPGGDDGQWGNLLNDFLLVSHFPDGSLQIADIVAAKYVKPTTGIPKADLSDDVQAALDTAMSGVAPDASPTVKGLVRLSGDLTGDALSPLIGTGKVTGGTGGSIATGTVTNDNLHASANIAKSKLAPLALTNDDIAVGAAIVQSKIVNLASDLASKASVSHAHAISDVTNLQTTLDSKAATSHAHGAGDISSGTLAIGRIPTGTTSTTVALGDHGHANYAALSHAHAIGDTTGLQGALDSKATSVHGHAINEVSNLQSVLDDKAAATHGHVIANVTNLQASLDGKAATTHTHAIANTTGLQAALDSKSVDGHGHTVAQVEDLQDILDAKSDDGHGHAIGEVTNLQSTLDGKAATVHSHTIASTTGLQTALDAKAATSHGHVVADTTGLQTALDGKASTVHAHTIANVTNLQTTLDAKSDDGHGHAIADVANLQTNLDGKAAVSHGHTIAQTTGLQTALDSKSATGHGHAIADTTGLQAALNSKTNTGHMHLASNVTDLSDAVADIIGDKVTAGANISVQYDAGTGLTTISSTVAPETGEPSDTVLSVAGRTGDVVLVAGDIASGTFGSARIPSLDTAKVTTGTFDIGRIPTGTSAVTVALGNHAHAGYALLDHDHAIEDVTNLQATLDGKSNTGHGHSITDTTGLQTALDGKAATAHSHTVANTTGLQTILDSKAAVSHSHNASDISAGTLDIARVPTGTTGTTVALGNHAHSNYSTTGHAHVAADVTDLQGLLDAKAAVAHAHTIANVTNLQSTLDAKSATGHGHAIADTTGLQTALDGKSATGHGHAVSDVASLQGLLDGKSDIAHGHTVNDVANLQASLNAKADTAHDHVIANVTGLQTALDAKSSTAHTHAASSITSGTLDIARVPTGTTGTTVALGNHAHTDYAATSHAHAAADVTSGTFDVARIPTGTSGTTVALGNHGHTIANVTNLQTTLDAKAASVHTHDDRYYTESEVDAALSAKIGTAEKGAANGLATLGADSKIPASQLPSLAIKDTFTVASQAAMLALTAERGDMAIRTDNGDTFVLASDSPSTLGDWKKLTNGYTSPVASVAGKTGAVTLVKGDVGLGNVDNTSDANKPVSTSTQTALDAKAATSHTHTIANVTNLQTTLDAKIAATEKAAASGVATLDSGTKVPIAQIPTGVTGTTVSLGDHTHTGFAATTHVHAATDVTSGTLAIARIPTGTTSTTVSLGNHVHAGTAITTGTIAIARLPTGTTNATVSLGDHTHTGYANTVHTHVISDTTNLQTTLDAKIAATEKGAASGVATLGSDGKVPTAQLPAATVSSVAGKTGAVTLVKGDVGLGNVDNTTDLAKPISTATQTALNGKASIIIDPVNESSYPDGTIFLYTV